MIPPRFVFAVVLLAVAVRPAAAQVNYSWTGNSPSNTATASWTFTNNYFLPSLAGGPSPGDRVAFDNLTTGNVNTVLDNNFSLTGLTVTGGVVSAADPILIGPGSSAANTLTVLGEGINLSAANRSLTVTAPLAVGASQTWAVNGGRTLTLSGAVSSTAARTVTVNANAGNTLGHTGTVVLGAANSLAVNSVVNVRNGTLRLDNLSAFPGVGGTGGLLLTPLSSGAVGVDGPTAEFSKVGLYTTPVTLSSGASGSLLRSRVNVTSGGATDLGALNLTGTNLSGVVELNALNGSDVRVLGTVNGSAHLGTLQLGGASGSGRLNGAVTLSPAGQANVTKVDSGSTWTLAAAGNSWLVTQVAAGTLRTTASGALPPAALTSLGQQSSSPAERLGTLDLFGTNQTVGGLSVISDDTQVNPAGNRIGIGDVTGPGPFASTLTFSATDGTGWTFAGALVDNVGTTGGKTLGLTVGSGNLTLQAANTYSGPTTITGAGVFSGVVSLTLSQRTGSAGGGFTNNGSIANSPLVTLATTGASLNAFGLSGGLSYDATTGNFAVASNQTLQGVGTVAGNGVTVTAAASLRGGLPGNVATPLAVGGLVLRGGTPGTGGGQLLVDVNNSATGSSVGRVAAGGPVNFDTATNAAQVVLKLLNDQNLAFGTPVSLNIGSGTAFRVNGAAVGPGGYVYNTDFSLLTDRPNFLFFQNVTLIPDGSNNLLLSFTPVPEPATVLGLAATGLAAVRLGRRRILAG